MTLALNPTEYATTVPTKPLRKIGVAEGRPVTPLGLSFRWKATGPETGYAFAVYEMEMAPGTGIPMHVHPFAEFFYVLGGEVEVLGLDDGGGRTAFAVGAGEGALAPANSPHGLRNVSAAPARFLSVANFEHEEAFNRIERAMAEAGADGLPDGQRAEMFMRLAAESGTYFFED